MITSKTALRTALCSAVLALSSALLPSTRAQELRMPQIQAPPIPAYDPSIYERKVSALKAESGKASYFAKLADVRLEQGLVKEARAAVDDGAKQFPGAEELVAPTVDALVAQGEYDKASDLIANAPEKVRLTPRMRLAKAELDLTLGRFDKLEDDLAFFVKYFNDNDKLGNGELFIVARALWLLAKRKGDKDMYQKVAGGNDSILGAMTAADPNDYKALSFWGTCYLEKYNTKQASKLFLEALGPNPSYPEARLGRIACSMMAGEDVAIMLLKQLAKDCPQYADCRVFLARMLSAKEQDKDAVADLKTAFEINPRHPAAMVAYASIQLILTKDMEGFAETEAKAAKYGLNLSEFYSSLASICSSKMFFDEAKDFYKKAVNKDPKNWEAIAGLGNTFFREGQEEEGKASLQLAFEKDPFNVNIINYLKLIDILEKEYVTINTEHFRIRVHKSELDIMAPYVTELAEETYRDFVKRYSYEPALPVVLDVYADHRDFSVRTVGMEGLGALGACLGKVVTIDSPYAKEQLAQIGASDFNWGSVFWHEFAHVMALQMTKFRVPRWFTEGLSTYEESLCRPGWDRDMELELLQAYYEGKLTSLDKLKNGGDLINLYYYGSVICKYLTQNHGFGKIVQMLNLWGEGKKDDEVFKTALGKTVAEFDAELKEYMKTWAAGFKYAPFRQRADLDLKTLAAAASAAGPEDAKALGRLAFALLRAEKFADAEQTAAKALAIDPKQLEACLAMGYARFANDDFAAAKKFLSKAVNELGYDYYEARFPLADSLNQLHETDAAIEEYLKAITCFPKAIERGNNPYDRLIKIYSAKKNVDKTREYLEKLVGMDQLEFNYRKALAKIYRAKGEPDKAMYWLSQMVFIDPNDLVIHDMMGRIWFEKKEFAKAKTEYDVAIALQQKQAANLEDEVNNKALASLLASRAEVLIDLGDKESARRDASKAMELDPSSEKAYEILKKSGK